MDWAVALTSASSALNVVKALRDIDKAADEAGFRAQLVGLQEQITDLREALLEARKEAEQSESEIARLTAFPTDVSKFFARHGYLYETGANGEGQGAPFCPYCIETKIGVFRLHKIEGQPRGTMYCPHCKNEFARVPTLPWPDGEQG